MTRGRFIVFEGIDGSGKGTQIKLLAERLRKEGKRIHLTAEPTESVSGGMLRDALCGAVRRTPAELAALFLLDRINHNVNAVNGINKMLNDGYDVICDRYYYSSFAYQGGETDGEWVFAMNMNCPEILKPDVCVFLDLDEREAMKRITADRTVTDIFEKAQTLAKIRKKYFAVFDRTGRANVRIIDASRDRDSIAEDVYKAVTDN